MWQQMHRQHSLYCDAVCVFISAAKAACPLVYPATVQWGLYRAARPLNLCDLVICSCHFGFSWGVEEVGRSHARGALVGREGTALHEPRVPRGDERTLPKGGGAVWCVAWGLAEELGRCGAQQEGAPRGVLQQGLLREGGGSALLCKGGPRRG
jgi:hypothetical protein